ncbi:MAG: hypothetical protein IT393_02355 [Nitrospirae bacterium]|nr:hypothetical protein [Nitrospirota bacterium]
MCSTAGGHSHAAHGTLTNEEKAAADLRNDLGEVLQLVNKLEHQRAIMSGAEFSAADDIVHTLEHIIEEQKGHAALLIQLINEVDMVQRSKFEGEEEGNNGHEHGHGHEHPHGHEHAHKH